MTSTTHSWERTTIDVRNPDNRTFTVKISGRELWTLAQLHMAGATGCTAAEHPGVRLAAYVHRLRKRGLRIMTLQKPNDGDFHGYHAAYLLLSEVTGLPGEEVAE